MHATSCPNIYIAYKPLTQLAQLFLLPFPTLFFFYLFIRLLSDYLVYSYRSDITIKKKNSGLFRGGEVGLLSCFKIEFDRFVNPVFMANLVHH